jgi:O-antigen/teichoic acid export membrane protein
MRVLARQSITEPLTRNSPDPVSVATERTVRFGASSLATALTIQLLNVCSGVMLARMLGPAGRGELAAIILWPALLAGLGNMGIYESTVFFASRGDHDVRVITASSFMSALGMSIIVVSIALAVIPAVLGHFGSSIVRTCLLYLSWVPLNLLTYAAAGVLVGRRKNAAFNRSRFIYPVVTVSSLMLLVLTGHPSVGAVAVVYVLAAAVAFGYLTSSLARSRLVGLRPDWRLTREILAYGFKAHVGNVAGLANDRADQAIVSIFLAPVYLGYYAVAVTVSSVVSLLGSSMATAALPAVAGATDDSERNRLFAVTVKVTLWGSLIGSLALLPMAPLVIHLFFGKRFLPAILSAEILAVACFAYSVSRVLTAGLVGLRRPWIASSGQVIGLIVTIMGLSFLVPWLGIVGAALATLLAYFTTLAYLIWVCSQTNIDPRQLLLRKADLVRVIGWLSRSRPSIRPPWLRTVHRR